MDLQVRAPERNVIKRFYSADIGQWSIEKNRTGDFRPFAPIVLAGRTGHTETILFHARRDEPVMQIVDKEEPLPVHADDADDARGRLRLPQPAAAKAAEASAVRHGAACARSPRGSRARSGTLPLHHKNFPDQRQRHLVPQPRRDTRDSAPAGATPGWLSGGCEYPSLRATSGPGGTGMPCQRTLPPAGVLTAALLLATRAGGWYFAGKTIDLVVGNYPGGGFDIYARASDGILGRNIPGQPTVVVKNMPGAGSAKAGHHIQNIAPDDGLTIGAARRLAPSSGRCSTRSRKPFSTHRLDRNGAERRVGPWREGMKDQGTTGRRCRGGQGRFRCEGDMLR